MTLNSLVETQRTQLHTLRHAMAQRASAEARATEERNRNRQQTQAAWQQAQLASSQRRTTALVFTVLALIFFSIASFLLRQFWNTESTYRSGVASMEAKQWERARTLLQGLADKNYKDAQVLVRESYYRPAVALLEAGQWEQSRQQLNELQSRYGDYADARTLMKETYYRPAVTAIGNGRWEEAAELISRLSDLDWDYRGIADQATQRLHLKQALVRQYGRLWQRKNITKARSLPVQGGGVLRAYPNLAFVDRR